MFISMLIHQLYLLGIMGIDNLTLQFQCQRQFIIVR